MMTSSNGNIFRITGHLCGEFTGPGEFPAQRPVTRSLMFSLICVWINDWINNRQAGDLRRYSAHYDVTLVATATAMTKNDAKLTVHRCSNFLSSIAVIFTIINTLRPRWNEQHFADDIFKCIFFNENVWISINISRKFVPKVQLTIFQQWFR